MLFQSLSIQIKQNSWERNECMTEVNFCVHLHRAANWKRKKNYLYNNIYHGFKIYHS